MTDASFGADFMPASISLVLIVLVLSQRVGTALHLELSRYLALILERFQQLDWSTCVLFAFELWLGAAAAVARVLVGAVLARFGTVVDRLGSLCEIA